MRLRILLPTKVLASERVRKVTAEAIDGAVCLLPRHVDFVAALQAGILGFESEDGRDEFVAIDEGILVKIGEEVLISTRNAARGRRLGELQRTVEEQFRRLDENQKKGRSAAAQLEAQLVRRFLELQHHE